MLDAAGQAVESREVLDDHWRALLSGLVHDRVDGVLAKHSGGAGTNVLENVCANGLQVGGHILEAGVAGLKAGD